MILLAMAAVFLGALLSSVVGFAFGLVVLPALLVLGMSLPSAVLTVLLVGSVTRVPDLWAGRSLIDKRRLGLLIGSCLIGCVPGFLVVMTVPHGVLRRAAGLLCLIAVAMQLWGRGRPRPTSRGATASLGALGGVLGPTVGLSGVPASMLYFRANVAADQTIAELSGYFVVTNSVMIACLWALEGSMAVEGTLFLAFLVVGVLGAQLGTLLSRSVSQPVFRSLTFAVALASGAACLLAA